MLNLIDYTSIVLILGILIFLVNIINQKNRLGKMENKIIEAKIILIFLLNTVMIINVYQMHETLKSFHLIIFSIFIILNIISFIFFYNNIREKGLVINFKKILWEDIRKIKKTNHYIEVFYKKDKRIFIDILNFNSSFLEKECKKRKIQIEFPHRK